MKICPKITCPSSDRNFEKAKLSLRQSLSTNLKKQRLDFFNDLEFGMVQQRTSVVGSANSRKNCSRKNILYLQLWVHLILKLYKNICLNNFAIIWSLWDFRWIVFAENFFEAMKKDNRMIFQSQIQVPVSVLLISFHNNSQMWLEIWQMRRSKSFSFTTTLKNSFAFTIVYFSKMGLFSFIFIF